VCSEGSTTIAPSDFVTDDEHLGQWEKSEHVRPLNRVFSTENMPMRPAYGRWTAKGVGRVYRGQHEPTGYRAITIPQLMGSGSRQRMQPSLTSSPSADSTRFGSCRD